MNIGGHALALIEARKHAQVVEAHAQAVEAAAAASLWERGRVEMERKIAMGQVAWIDVRMIKLGACPVCNKPLHYGSKCE